MSLMARLLRNTYLIAGRRRNIILLQALAQLIHFVANLAHESISIRGDAAIAAVDFLQQAERLLPKHTADNRTKGG